MTTHLQNSRDVSQFGRVGLLYGGTSSEREISLMSGEAVYGALINMGVDTLLIDAQDDIATQLADYDLDRIFIALHGPCLLYTSPSPRDRTRSRMPSSA